MGPSTEEKDQCAAGPHTERAGECAGEAYTGREGKFTVGPWIEPTDR